MNVRDLAKARVVVVGDAMIDRWVWGHYSKIGPEGVPVFLQEKCEDRPGGADNVRANLNALGCDVRLFSKPFEQMPIKTRFAATGAVFRSDKEDCSPIDESLERAIMGRMEAFRDPQVLVISDYAKGVCTPSLCQQLIAWAKAKGIKVVVDPKGDDWSKYDGAYIVTPNAAEWEELTACPKSIDHVLETRGAEGMTLHSFDGQIHIPATAREVYDVTGAGDTVVAVLAASLAVGFDLETAARMANAAAGVVVGKRGTATCSLEELEAAYKPAERKSVVGFTNGCFDLLHEGHRHFLRECQKQCDKLTVLVNTDDSVRALKGQERPKQNQSFRLHNVQMCLRPDDIAALFDGDKELHGIYARYKPDVIFKGSEYAGQRVIGDDLAKIVFIPMLPGFSTTLEIARRA